MAHLTFCWLWVGSPVQDLCPLGHAAGDSSRCQFTCWVLSGVGEEVAWEGPLRLLYCKVTGDPERGVGITWVWTLMWYPRGFSWKQQGPDAEAVWSGGKQRDSTWWMLKNTWAQDVVKVRNEKTYFIQ